MPCSQFSYHSLILPSVAPAVSSLCFIKQQVFTLMYQSGTLHRNLLILLCLIKAGYQENHMVPWFHIEQSPWEEILLCGQLDRSR